MIPNRDSMPQNHPKPNDAVSNAAGASASMAGMAEGVLSFVWYVEFIAYMLVSCDEIAVVAMATTAIIPMDSNHPMPGLHLIFFMVLILSFFKI